MGVDPGLRFTGWGVVSLDDGGVIRYINHGVISIPAKLPIQQRLYKIYEGIHTVLCQEKIEEVAIEEVFVNKNGQSTMKLCMARGVAILPFGVFGKPVFEYAANHIKRSVLGLSGGHASKEVVKNILKHICVGIPESVSFGEANDGTDALAIAVCHAQQRKLSSLLAEA
ncbi:MAG: crossover junction endodeoxyribonuclease RuvC [Holosporales bacterium]|jgi:crossover junction endodeoxyribonuclease RuvC|nr:crossover junction endodeoxyribonuclease RuvC [Holosporales bacterium]